MPSLNAKQVERNGSAQTFYVKSVSSSLQKGSKIVKIISARHPDVLVGTVGVLTGNRAEDGDLGVFIAGSWLVAGSDRGVSMAERREIWYGKWELEPVAAPAYITQILKTSIRLVYLAGPMSNHKHHNKPAFWLAERILTEHSIGVSSPANYPQVMNYAWYMKEDIKKLLGCPGVFMLSGWQGSKGASLEHQIAEITGKQIFYQDCCG